MNESLFALASFLFFTLGVAFISSRLTRRAADTGAAGYFMAGKSLTGWFICGSMLLTNLSAEQLVGLNGQSFAENLSSMAWESTAALSTIMLAMFFLPRYLKGGFTTLPEYLELRYDPATRRIVSGMFILGYTLVANPVALYLGAISLDEVFSIHTALGLPHDATIWLLVWVMGAVGAAYAIFGGLRAVAVSDSINGIVLLIASLLVPVLALIALGNGSFNAGLQTLLTEHTDKLNAVGDSSSGQPFGTLFTGMIFANLFYWCTNQATIQRTLAAKNLAEGQKGVLFTGFIKILVPLVMLIPGVVAFHLVGDTLPKPDLAYPALIKLVMPWWLLGFFVAAFFGTVISHFNSIVNSTATLFAMDWHRAYRPNTPDAELVRVGKWVGSGFAMISMVIAPLLLYVPDGIYLLIRKVTGFYNIPIIAIVLAGFFLPKVPGWSARIVLISHVVLYAIFVLGLKVDVLLGINFVHIMGILFTLHILFLAACGWLWPRKSRAGMLNMHSADPQKPVYLQPWRFAYLTSVLLVCLLVSMYLTFSSLGLANPEGVTLTYQCLMSVIWSGFVLYVLYNRSRGKYTHHACHLMEDNQ
ncbi:MAG: solute:sodium symporter family transporter [Plesiomonas sp.]